ncbi:hypothetical protein [Methanosarcina sp. UBA5]|nr:hypothetical protein [Methanosarcina sp. UBA5]
MIKLSPGKVAVKPFFKRLQASLKTLMSLGKQAFVSGSFGSGDLANEFP